MSLREATQQARPPFVEFEERAVEDRAETIAQGGLVMKSVDFAILHPLGSKDTVEKVATEWLDYIDRQSQRGDYSREWAKFFREQYNDWKEGADPDKVIGLHVRNWAAISRATAETLIGAGIRSVEDLAAAPEQALQRIGMGARDLKRRAQAYLDSAEAGKGAEELALLRDENVNLKAEVAELRGRIDQLTAAIERQQPTDQAEKPRRRSAA